MLLILIRATLALDPAFLDDPYPSNRLRDIRVKGQLVPHAAYHANACYTAQGDLLILLEDGVSEAEAYCSVNARISNLVNVAAGQAINFRILTIPLVEMATLSGLTFLAPAPGHPVFFTESFEFRTRRSIADLARRPALPPAPANAPLQFQAHSFQGFIALSQEETPLMAQSSPQMALAYAAAVPTFLGPGHPGWRHRGEDAAVTWAYPLTQGMMHAAQAAAITRHQVEAFQEWMVAAQAAGHLDVLEVQNLGWEIFALAGPPVQVNNFVEDDDFMDQLDGAPLLGGAMEAVGAANGGANHAVHAAALHPVPGDAHPVPEFREAGMLSGPQAVQQGALPQHQLRDFVVYQGDLDLADFDFDDILDNK